MNVDPDPYAPFRLAQAHRVGELLFVSGQAAVDGEGNIFGMGVCDEQAGRAFGNLRRVLHAGGSSLANVVKVTIFLTDMDYFDRVVALREAWFTPPYPADSIVEVRSLFSADAMIEIEAIAILDRAARWIDE